MLFVGKCCMPRLKNMRKTDRGQLGLSASSWSVSHRGIGASPDADGCSLLAFDNLPGLVGIEAK